MTATMEQATKTEVVDRTTIEAEPDTDAAGENVLLPSHGGFDLGDMDLAAGDASSSSTPNPNNNPAPAGAGWCDRAYMCIEVMMYQVRS